MAKKIALLISALLLLSLIGIGLLIWNINPIVESFRPEITRLVSSAVKQPVTLGELRLKFFPTLAVDIAEVSLQPPQGTQNPDAQLKDVSIGADISSLLKRQLNVEHVKVGSLRLAVVRLPNGQLQVGDQILGQAPAEKAPESAASSTGDKPAIILNIKNTSIESGTLVFEDRSVTPVQKFSIDDLHININGISLAGAEKFQIGASLFGKKKSNFKLDGKIKMAPGAPIPVDAETKLEWAEVDLDLLGAALAAYKVGTPGIELHQHATIELAAASAPNGFSVKSKLDLTQAAVTVPGTLNKEAGLPLVANIDGKGDFSTLQLEKFDLVLGRDTLSLPLSIATAQSLLKAKASSQEIHLGELGSFLPAVAAMKLGGSIVPNIAADVDIAPGEKAALSRLKGLSGNIEFRQVSLEPISHLNGKAELHPNEIVLKPMSFSMSGQQVTMGARVSDWSQPKFQIAAQGVFGGKLTVDGSQPSSTQILATVKADSLNVGQLTQTLSPQGRIQLSGTMESLSANISGNPAQFAPTLSAAIETAIVKGAIHGVNIVGKALNKLSDIPGLGVSVLQYVPEKFRGVVASESTEFDRLTVRTHLQGKNIQLDQINLTHEMYSISGSGKIAENGDMKINASLNLTPITANDMILRQPKFKLLLDSAGNISFPVVISRSNGIFLVLPDTSQLAKMAVKNTATEAAGRALDKIAPGLGKGLGGALDSIFK